MKAVFQYISDCENKSTQKNTIISRPELKIRREVLDWSAYHAAAAAPRFWLNISVAIDPRLLKSKIWNLCKKSIFLFIFCSPGPIRLIVLINNSFSFKVLQFGNQWLDLHETYNIGGYNYYPQLKKVICTFSIFSGKWRPF